MAGRGLLALALERQVSAAERLLTTLATSDVFEEISAQQADAVVQAMATGKLTVLELADLSASVDKVPFAPGDKQKVVDAMALAARDASKPTKNSKEKDDGKQHWQSAWAYVPKEVWESLGEQEVGPCFELLSQMGLVLPGETTFMTLALMIMVATDGIEKTRALSVEVRLAMVKSVKTLWTKRQKACGLQHESFKIKILPETVAEFKALHGDVYEAVFSSKGFVPAQSPIGPLEIAALEDCSRCRGLEAPSHVKAVGLLSRVEVALLGTFNFPIVTDFSDFLGRLQPSRTTIQKTLDTLGVEQSSSPRRVLHF